MRQQAKGASIWGQFKGEKPQKPLFFNVSCNMFEMRWISGIFQVFLPPFPSLSKFFSNTLKWTDVRET